METMVRTLHVQHQRDRKWQETERKEKKGLVQRTLYRRASTAPVESFRVAGRKLSPCFAIEGRRSHLSSINLHWAWWKTLQESIKKKKKNILLKIHENESDFIDSIHIFMSHIFSYYSRKSKCFTWTTFYFGRCHRILLFFIIMHVGDHQILKCFSFKAHGSQSSWETIDLKPMCLDYSRSDHVWICEFILTLLTFEIVLRSYRRRAKCLRNKSYDSGIRISFTSCSFIVKHTQHLSIHRAFHLEYNRGFP